MLVTTCYNNKEQFVGYYSLNLYDSQSVMFSGCDHVHYTMLLYMCMYEVMLKKEEL